MCLPARSPVITPRQAQHIVAGCRHKCVSVPTGPFLLPFCSDTMSPLPHPCGTPGHHCSVFRFHNCHFQDITQMGS